MAEPQQISAALFAALREEGIEADGIEIQPFDGFGEGVATTRDCTAGAEMLRLPLHLCLTNRPVDAPKRLRPMLEDAFGPGFGGGTLPLCVRIWSERLRPSSRLFATWLEYLEQSFGAKRNLQCRNAVNAPRCGPLSPVPQLVEAALQQRAALSDRLQQLAEQFPDELPRAPNAEEVEWLHSLCTTRALSLPCSNEDGHPTIVQLIAPVVDFVNHTFQPSEASFVQLCEGHIVLQAPHDLTSGSQLLGAYFGAATNDDLVVDAGFASMENPNHTVALSLSFPRLRSTQEETLRRLQLDRYLRAGKPGHTAVSIMLRQADPFPAVAVVLCRILSGSETSDDLEKLVSESTADMDKKWVPVLLQALKGNLQAYPAVESDEDLESIVYSSTRAVLKAAVSKLLGYEQLLTVE